VKTRGAATPSPLRTWALCRVLGALLISTVLVRHGHLQPVSAFAGRGTPLTSRAAPVVSEPARTAGAPIRLTDDPAQPQLKTASSHPIQYYLSLPDGWRAGKKYPVAVVIESAERDFQKAATLFCRSPQRGSFILVTPLVVTNGGAGYRNVPTYHYSDAVWNRIQTSGDFTFDMDGITAIMQDVVRLYGGYDKYFITGFEAGGHTVWAILFNHPEVTRGAAIVIPNYLGRWVDEAHISTYAGRADLPIRILLGANDNFSAAGSPIYSQLQRAMSLAKAHGYQNLSQVSIEGKGHEALADDVLAYFSSLLQH